MIRSSFSVKFSNNDIGSALQNVAAFVLNLFGGKSSFRSRTISNFGFEFVLTVSWLKAPSMVISIVRRHPALLLGKQRFERADA